MATTARSNPEILLKAREKGVRHLQNQGGPSPVRHGYVLEREPPQSHPIQDPGIQIYESPCKSCNICDLHFAPKEKQRLDAYVYTNAVTDIEASVTISSLLEGIDADRQSLLQILASQGDNLLKRWTNKTNEPRVRELFKIAELEEKAAPQLPRFYAWDWGWPDKRRYRAAFMFPYLNKEAILENRSRLLRIVYNRTRWSPKAYFRENLQSLMFPDLWGLFDKTFNRNCVVVQGDRWGSLCPWNADQMHRGEIVGFPLAKIALEAQSMLMRALLSIVRGILEHTKESSGNAKWTEAAGKDFDSTVFRGGELGFHRASLERAYGPPERLDASCLRDLADSHLEAVCDDLRQFQQDPGFVQRRLGDIRNEWAPSAKFFSSHASLVLWYVDWRIALHWSAIRSKLVELDEDAKRRAGGPDQVDTLVAPSDDTIDHTLLREASGVMYRYWAAWSHALSAHLTDTLRGFSRNSPIDNGSRRLMFFKDPLVWALLELCQHDVRPCLHYGLVTEFLAQQLTRADQRDRLDWQSFRWINDLLSLYEIAEALYRPSRDADPTSEVYSGERHGQPPNIPYIEPDFTANEARVIDTMDSAGDHLKAVEKARWPKKLTTAASYTIVMETRRELSKFWNVWREFFKAVRDESRAKGEKVQWNADSAECWTWFECDREADYLARLQKEETELEAIKARSSRKRGANPTPSVKSHTSNISHSSTPEPEDKFTPPTKKAKQKTAGAIDLTVDARVPDLLPDSPPDSPSVTPVLVSKKSLPVIARIFAGESGNVREGTIRWNDVCAAMAETGFSVQPTGGSVVVFLCEGGPGGRVRTRFSLHRAHNDGDQVSSRILKRIGYRLRSRMGWTWDIFDERPRDLDDA